MLRSTPPAYLTPKEVALELRQHPETVRRKIRDGEIPAVKVGLGPPAPLRVPVDELQRWLYSEEPPAGLSSSLPAAGNPAERRVPDHAEGQSTARLGSRPDGASCLVEERLDLVPASRSANQTCRTGAVSLEFVLQDEGEGAPPILEALNSPEPRDSISRNKLKKTRGLRPMKTCRKCGDEKPQAEFPPNRRCRDGLSSWCRECHLTAVRESRVREDERAREAQWKRQQEHNRRAKKQMEEYRRTINENRRRAGLLPLQ
jgi:excisionase family DNA binding protein